MSHDNINYSLFHYIVEADTPKRAWDTLKEVFIEEPTVEEYDFVSRAKHQESHTEVEDSQDDSVYEAASDHVIPANDIDRVMFDDDSENKPVTAAVLNDVSDSLFEQEIVDGSIETAIVVENEQQPADIITKETTLCSPPQNQKTRSLREIYKLTPISNEHLQYALFSSQHTIF